MTTSQTSGPGGVAFAAALDALDDAGVQWRIRKHATAPDLRELDIWLPRKDLESAEAALVRAGFAPVRAPGHGRHRFYVSFRDGRWVKLDAKIEALGTVQGERRPGRVSRVLRRIEGWAGRSRVRALGRARDAVRRRRPAALRRLGPVIALLGPDGSGKGSVAARLQAEIPVAVTVVYLGRRQAAKRHVPGTVRPKGRDSAVREVASVVKKFLRLGWNLSAAYAAAWRGHIVLLDRHPIEALAVRPQRGHVAEGLERMLCSSLTPWPDRVVLLDAPGAMMHERKGEHSADALERTRQVFLEFFGPRGATVVSTVQPLEGSVAGVSAVVWDALRERGRRRPRRAATTPPR